MLGSGVFVLPAIAYVYTGASVWLAYLLAAILVLPAAFSQSELSTAMPSSGGSYTHLQRTFGPLVGTITGLGLFICLTLKSAFSLVGFGAYLSILGDFSIKITALILLSIIVVLNVLGISKVTKLILGIVYITIAALAILFFQSYFTIDVTNMTPFFKNGFFGLFEATALIFLSFSGILKVSAIGEEIQSPEKNLYLSTILSIFIIALIYCLLTLSLVGNVSSETLGKDLHPLYDLAVAVGPNYWGIIISVVGVVSMTAMANAGLLAASRFPLAMSRDHLLPSFFSLVDKKYLTPLVSIVTTGVFVFIFILFLDVEKIVKAASSFFILIYIMINMTVVILRESRVQWYKPQYKSPFYPFTQIFGIISGTFLFMIMGMIPLLACALTLLAGYLFYTFYGREKASHVGVLKIYGKRKDLVEETEEIQLNEMENPVDVLDTSRNFPVIVALFKREKSLSEETLVEFGVALCKVFSGEKPQLKVVHLTEIPEHLDLSEFDVEFNKVKSLDRRVRAISQEKNTLIEFDPLVSHDMYKTLNQLVSYMKCDWLILEWKGKTGGAFTFERPIGWLKDHLPCHVVHFTDKGVRYFRKILFLYQSDIEDPFVLKVADELSLLNQAELTICCFIPAEINDENLVNYNRKKIDDLAKTCSSPTKVVFIRKPTSTKLETLKNLTTDYDLLIFKTQPKKGLSYFFGEDHDKISSESNCSVISIRPKPEQGGNKK